MQPQQIIKHAGDATAYGTVVATLIGWLPAIAALFTILWLSMQMVEKLAGKPLHELVKCAWVWFKGLRG